MQLAGVGQGLQVVCSSRQPARRVARHWGAGRRQNKGKDTPIGRYLRSSLALRDQVVDGVISLCPSLTEFGASEVDQLVDQNISLLRSLATRDQVRSIILSCPRLLAVPLASWFDFFSSYGLEGTQFWRLLCSSPYLLLRGSVFKAGGAIMFLKALGWSDLEITTIIIPYHAEVLQMDVESQLQPVLLHLLQDRGMTPQAATEFLHQHPDVMYKGEHEVRIQQLLRKQQLLQCQCI